jgi:hypothetical protein
MNDSQKRDGTGVGATRELDAAELTRVEGGRTDLNMTWDPDPDPRPTVGDMVKKFLGVVGIKPTW